MIEDDLFQLEGACPMAPSGPRDHLRPQKRRCLCATGQRECKGHLWSRSFLSNGFSGDLGSVTFITGSREGKLLNTCEF